MPVTITGQAKLHGLQHAEQNTILAYFKAYFSMGKIAITGYTAAAGGTMITVFFTGPGGAGHKGSEVFSVPGPEVGSGISFAIAASVLGLFAYYRAKKSSAA